MLRCSPCSAPGTSSFAVHIALHEVGAKFESRISSFKSEQRSPNISRSIRKERSRPRHRRPSAHRSRHSVYSPAPIPKRTCCRTIRKASKAISWMSHRLHSAPGRWRCRHTKKVLRIADQIGRFQWRHAIHRRHSSLPAYWRLRAHSILLRARSQPARTTNA
jgi:hypothetical protein